MSIKATVTTTPKNRISINNQQRTEIRTVGVIPEITLVNSLRVLIDVNATSLANNNTLVYDSASDKFVVKDLPGLNGGSF